MIKSSMPLRLQYSNELLHRRITARVPRGATGDSAPVTAVSVHYQFTAQPICTVWLVSSHQEGCVGVIIYFDLMLSVPSVASFQVLLCLLC